MEHTLLAYDAASAAYFDVFDKNRYDDDHWERLAFKMAENGTISQKFAITDCLVTESDA